MSGTTGILGHSAAITPLWRALAAGALHHAILLEGPTGIGKSLIAERLAQAGCCEAIDHPAPPCGACGGCVAVAKSTHPDVLHLKPDPARASGAISVDEVRELVRQLGYHRYRAKRRTVIIDPVEGLLDSAANALLKTLEEPPAGTGFILISHGTAPLLPTILSRCQRVRLGTVPEPDLVTWLVAQGHDPSLAQRSAALSMGVPGQALALAQGELEARTALRDELLGILRAGPSARFDWAEARTKGTARPAQSLELQRCLAIIEELARDAAVWEDGSHPPLLHPDIPDVIAAWHRRLGPVGLAEITSANDQARADAEAFVAGRLLLDAWLSRVATALGLR